MFISVESGSLAAKTLANGDAPRPGLVGVHGQHAGVRAGGDHAGERGARSTPASSATASAMATFSLNVI